MLKKIVAIGPESTGKSELCQELAAHYNSSWVKEYAREFLLEHGNKYKKDDLLSIAKGQLEMEEIASGNLYASEELRHTAGKKENSLLPLFIDTDMYVMKVWSEYVFNQCHLWILDRIAERNYDLYLLCNTDLPWVPDELREYPDIESRNILYHIYKDILINQQVPWVEISGNGKKRFEKAKEAVDGLFSAPYF